MQISNARYINAAGLFDVTVTPHEGEPFDYTVAPEDVAPMAASIRAAVEAEQIPIAPYVEPPPPRKMIRKSLVQQRLIDAGLMDAAHAALWMDKAAFARWFAPDHPKVYIDDPDALALLTAIGADPVMIMAPASPEE